MSEQPAIFVTVPIYNVKKYLRRRLDSAVNQTYRNLEIICVDEDSQGHSGRLLDEHVQKDDRVVVVHQKNRRHAVVRKACMDSANPPLPRNPFVAYQYL